MLWYSIVLILCIGCVPWGDTIWVEQYWFNLHLLLVSHPYDCLIYVIIPFSSFYIAYWFFIRTPLVSFLYERGWRQSFSVWGGFPGPEKEVMGFILLSTFSVFCKQLWIILLYCLTLFILHLKRRLMKELIFLSC